VSRPVTRPRDIRLPRAEPLTRFRTPPKNTSHDRKDLIESSVESSGRGPSGRAISTLNGRLVVAGGVPLSRLGASARAQSGPCTADLDLFSPHRRSPTLLKNTLEVQIVVDPHLTGFPDIPHGRPALQLEDFCPSLVGLVRTISQYPGNFHSHDKY
jgi:hypothetical protein